METKIMREIREKLSNNDVRLFRNNVGMGTTLHGLPIRFGLMPGSADLIGWVKINRLSGPIAIFLSIEVKRKNGKINPEQINWMDQVNKSGGIAFIASSVEEALLKLTEQKKRYE